jgi:signal peptidase I
MNSLVQAAAQATFSPARFFTSENLKNARAPELVYATALAGGAVGSAIYDAVVIGAVDVVGTCIAVVAQFIVAFPVLYVVAGVHHIAARVVLPGRADFSQSLAVVGYAGVPAVFGWSLWMSLAAGVWSLALIALGFARLRSVSVFRGALGPLLAVVLPLTTVLGVRTFVLEAFRVPTEGMFPTLTSEDHVFIGKMDFILGQAPPDYGDVIVFDVPSDGTDQLPQHFIDRVIALPRDTVEFRHGELLINGWIAPRCFVGTHQSGYVKQRISVQYLGENPFLIAQDESAPPEDWGPFTVPENQVFVVGDNRLHSHDSRAWNNHAGGGVDIDLIRGRAIAVWFPSRRMARLPGASPRLPPNALDLGDALRRCLAQERTSGRPPLSPPPT